MIPGRFETNVPYITSMAARKYISIAAQEWPVGYFWSASLKIGVL